MEPFEVVLCVVAALVGIPLVIIALLLLWPLLLCWWLGHPAIGVLAEVIYLASLR